MVNKVLIKKSYIDKIKDLNKHNELYYSKNNPSVTDKEFDDLKKDIIELEKKYKFLRHKDSPSQKIGFKPSKNFKNKNIKFQCCLSLMFLTEMICSTLKKKLKII